MKILILSVTAGQGHHQTGLAISAYFEQQGHEILQLDCYEYLSPLIKEMISHGYLMSTKYSPTFYGQMYRLAEKMDAIEKSNIIGKIANSIFYKKMLSFIEEYMPDVIISTHVFASVLLTYLKEKGLNIPTIGIVTDFTIHPYWEQTSPDYIVAANEYLVPSLLKKGFSRESILPIGIPIFDKFARKNNKDDARAKLNIDNKDTILIMGGSMGFGNILKTIERLDKSRADFQMITVCGNNHRLKDGIDDIETSHKIHNFGYVSNVDFMMDAADCVITKPGGLTVSESLAKELPMIISKPIPGQEERNLDFLLNFGCGMRISKTLPVDEIVSQLFLDEKKREIMINNMRLIKKPNSVKALYEHVILFQS